MPKRLSLLLLCTLSALPGCKGKKKAPAQPPPVAAATEPAVEAVPESPPPETPPPPLDRGIADGAVSRDGDVVGIVVRPKDGGDIQVGMPGGVFVFLRPKETAKSAVAGDWTVIRLLGSGSRFGVRQTWTFGADRLTITRVTKDDKAESVPVTYARQYFSMSQRDPSRGDLWDEKGVTTGRFMFSHRIAERALQHDDGADSAPTKEQKITATVGIRRQRCGQDAVIGTWREFRLAKKQITEWQIDKTTAAVSIWDDRRTGEPKLTRKGTYTFDAAACSIAFKPVVEVEGVEGGGAGPVFEAFFDPDGGMALGAIGAPTDYSHAGILFRSTPSAPSETFSPEGAWAVLRYPPRVGFLRMEADGAFSGQIGDAWDNPSLDVTGTLSVNAQGVGGLWVPKAPGAGTATAAPDAVPTAPEGEPATPEGEPAPPEGAPASPEGAPTTPAGAPTAP